MKKNSESGFMLIETLLVSTFVLGVLTYLFVQFSALKRNYDDNFKYDTVPGLYAVRNIHQYILSHGDYTSFNSQVNVNGAGYTEFNCTWLSGTGCSTLLEHLDIDKVYFVQDSIFKDKIDVTLTIFANDDELYHFAKKIGYSSETNAYHLIAKYKDNTFATLQVTI